VLYLNPGGDFLGGEVGSRPLPAPDDPLMLQISESFADGYTRHPELFRQAPLGRQPHSPIWPFDLADHVGKLPIERTLRITSNQARAGEGQVDDGGRIGGRGF